MSTLIGIPSGALPPPAVVTEPLERGSTPPTAPRTSPPVTTAKPADATASNTPDRAEIEAAITELREAMSRLPGGEREVTLQFEPEDHSYLVEIRNKETGAILQTFPPENLLNLRRRSADLLGVLIDRHS